LLSYFLELKLNQSYFAVYGLVMYTLASVSANDVRDVINGTSEEVPGDTLENDQKSPSQNGARNRQNSRQQQLQRLGKRIAGTKQTFLTKEEYAIIVDTADTNKLAKMLRLLDVPDANQSLPVLEQAKMP